MGFVCVKWIERTENVEVRKKKKKTTVVKRQISLWESTFPKRETWEGGGRGVVLKFKYKLWRNVVNGLKTVPRLALLRGPISV